MGNMARLGNGLNGGVRKKTKDIGKIFGNYIIRVLSPQEKHRLSKGVR